MNLQKITIVALLLLLPAQNGFAVVADISCGGTNYVPGIAWGNASVPPIYNGLGRVGQEHIPQIVAETIDNYQQATDRYWTQIAGGASPDEAYVNVLIMSAVGGPTGATDFLQGASGIDLTSAQSLGNIERVTQTLLGGTQLALTAVGFGGAITQAAGGLSKSATVTNMQAEAYLVRNGYTPALAKDYIASFEGPITARIAEPGEQFLRFTGNPQSQGSFLTKTSFSSPQEAVGSLNIQDYGNPATYVQEVTASGRSIVFEGNIKGGQAKQSIIINRSKFQFGTGTDY